jgi:hypothetical protein
MTADSTYDVVVLDGHEGTAIALADTECEVLLGVTRNEVWLRLLETYRGWILTAARTGRRRAPAGRRRRWR